MNEFQHQSVLLNEAMQWLQITKDGYYIDATFGRGGHSRSILQRLEAKGMLLAIDKDLAALEAAKQIQDERFRICHGSFADIASIANQQDLLGKVNGILMDLGVSSPQLDDGDRGFSFLKDGPLDMRMDTSSGESAKDYLARVEEVELVSVLKEYGEERFAKRIAKAIIAARAEVSISTTKQLADIVDKAMPFREKNKHPATRTFQAIRIAVNHELDDLKTALAKCLDVLAVGGRLVVISFHSLEDRIVKQFIKQESQGQRLPKEIPINDDLSQARLKKLTKAIKASTEEIKFNPRARSAVLRAAERRS